MDAEAESKPANENNDPNLETNKNEIQNTTQVEGDKTENPLDANNTIPDNENQQNDQPVNDPTGNQNEINNKESNKPADAGDIPEIDKEKQENITPILEETVIVADTVVVDELIVDNTIAIDNDTIVKEQIKDVGDIVVEPVGDVTTAMTKDVVEEEINPLGEATTSSRLLLDDIVEDAMNLQEMMIDVKDALDKIFDDATLVEELAEPEEDTQTFAKNIVSSIVDEATLRDGKEEEIVEEESLPKFVHRYLNQQLDESLDKPEVICFDLLNEIIDGVVPEEAREELEEEEEALEESEGEVDFLCQEFEDPEEVAKTVVEQTCRKATDYLKDHEMVLGTSHVSVKESSTHSVHGVHIQVFEKSVEEVSVVWPTVENFSVDAGTTTIYDFLETWNVQEEWLFCVKHLGCQSDQCVDYYYYEAIWSIPTNAYPIAQATASVFFTLNVSRIVPKHCTIKVTYQFEGTRFVHKPGKIDFQEDWLFYIIDSKLNFFKTLTF